MITRRLKICIDCFRQLSTDVLLLRDLNKTTLATDIARVLYYAPLKRAPGPLL